MKKSIKFFILLIILLVLLGSIVVYDIYKENKDADEISEENVEGYSENDSDEYLEDYSEEYETNEEIKFENVDNSNTELNN